MRRNWHYPRWRRVLMQVTMWGVLGATVAGAEWIVRRRSQTASATAWAATLTVGNVKVRLPSGWSVDRGRGGDDVLLEASELPADGIDAETPGRQLMVQQMPVKPAQTLEQFMAASGGPLKDAMVIEADGQSTPHPDESLPVEPTPVGPVPGLMLPVIRTFTSDPGLPVTRAHEWIACGIEPDGTHALVLRLLNFSASADDPQNRSDEQLLTRIAGEIKFRRAAPGAGP